MSFIHTIERTRTNTPQGAHPPGSIIHKKLLMQNRDKHPGTPRGPPGPLVPFHKMLASTMQFPNNKPVTPTAARTPATKRGGREPCGLGHARDNPGQTRPNPPGTGACCSRTQQCAKRPSVLVNGPRSSRRTCRGRTRRPSTNAGRP